MNTLGSSPRSIANQLMEENDNELWPQLPCVTGSQGTCPYHCHVTVQKTFAQISPSCHCFMRKLGYFFTIILDDIKIFPLLKLSQMGRFYL